MPVCHLTSYSVVQLHGLCLPSNTGLYDRAGSGLGGLPSPSQGVRRPASPAAQRANLTIMAVELPVEGRPPQVQYSWGRARAKARGLVRYRGLLCISVGNGWACVWYTAAWLPGNLLTQLGLAEILSGLAQITVQQSISCVQSSEESLNRVLMKLRFRHQRINNIM